MTLTEKFATLNTEQRENSELTETGKLPLSDEELDNVAGGDDDYCEFPRLPFKLPFKIKFPFF